MPFLLPPVLVAPKRFLRSLLALFIFSCFLTSPTFADNIKAVLDSTDGTTSAFVVQDSTSVDVVSFDADGNANLKGCLRMDASGAECVGAEGMVVDGRLGVGTGKAAPTYQIESAGTIQSDAGFRVGTGAGTQLGVDNALRPTLSSGYLNLLGGAENARISIGDADITFASGNGTQRLLLDSNGALIVGSSAGRDFAPNAGDLYIQNNLEVDGNVYLGDNVVLDNVTITGALNLVGATTYGGPITVTTDHDNALLVETAAGVDVFRVDTDTENDILIGTGSFTAGRTSTAADVHVSGNLETDQSLYADIVQADSYIYGVNQTLSGGLDVAGSATLGNVRTNANTIAATNDSGLAIRDNAGLGLTLADGGNLGIGATPNARLDVGGGTVTFIDGTNDLLAADDVEVDGSLYASFISVGASPSYDYVTGTDDLYVKGNLEVDGSVYLGDAVTDNLIVQGQLNLSGDTVYNGPITITSTDPGALLVEKTDGTDVLLVDTNAETLTLTGHTMHSGSMTVTGLTTLGNMQATGNTLAATDNGGLTLTDNAANGITLADGGYVGIGSTLPAERLDVAGNAVISGGVTVDTMRLVSGAITDSAGSITFDNENLSTTGTLASGTATVTGDMTVSSDATVAGTLTVGSTTVIDGSAGIGTSTPVGKLDVRGDEARIWTGAGTADQATGTGDLYVEGDLEVDGNVYLGDNAVVDNITIMGRLNLQGETSYDSPITITTTHTGALLVQKQDGTDVLNIDTVGGLATLSGSMTVSGDVTAAGTVRAGTSVRAGTLTAASGSILDTTGAISFGNENLSTTGTLASASAAITGDMTVSSDATVGGTLTVGSTTAIDGSVGIGTSAPVGKLDVRGDEARIWTGAGTVDRATNAGDMYVEGNLEVDGNVYLGDNAVVDNITITGQLNLLGDTTYGSPVTITTTDAGALLVEKQDGTDVLNIDTVDQTAVLTGDMLVTGDATVTGAVRAGTLTAAGGSVTDASGAISFGNENLSTSGTLSAGATSITGQTNITGGMAISDDMTVSGDATVGGALIVGTTAVIAGSTGIGTSTPVGKLDVRGDEARIWTGAGTADQATGTGDLYVEGDLEVDGNVYLGDNAVVDNITIMGRLNLQGETSYDSPITITTTNPGAFLVQKQDGTDVLNVDTVDGMATLSGSMTISSDVTAAGIVRAGTAVRAGTLTASSGSLTDTSGTISFDNENLITTGWLNTGAATVDSLYSEGAVGIGTSSPVGRLDVRGDEARIWTGAGTVDRATNAGDMYVEGNLEVDGNVYLGDNAVVDNITITGQLNLLGDTSYGSPVTITTTDAGALLVEKQDGTDVLNIDTIDQTAVLTGDMLVTGDATVTGAVRAGTFTAASGSLTDASGAISFGNENVSTTGTLSAGATTITGSMTITGDMTLTGDMTVSNDVTLGGDLRVGGVSAFDGSVGIGTDTPTGKLDVRGDEARIWTGAGTADQATGTGDLYVEGDFEVDGNVYLGDNAVVDNITIMGRLNLQGETSYDSPITITTTNTGALLVQKQDGTDILNVDTVDGLATLSGSMTVSSDVTAAGIVRAGTSVRAGTMTASSGSILDITGAISFGNENLSTTGTLASGTATVTGDMTVSSDATVGGTLTVGSTTAIDGSVGIGTSAPVGKLDVRGDEARIWTGAGTVDRATNAGDMYVEGNLEVDGNVYLGDNAVVDNITITGQLNLLGDTSYGSPVTITTTDAGALLVEKQDGTDVFNIDTIDQTAVLTGDMLVTGDATVTGAVRAGTLTAAGGSLTDASGAISFGNENLSTTGTLSAGATTITGQAAVTGSMTLTGDMTVSSDVTLGGNLIVGGISELAGNVGIGTSSPVGRLDVRGDEARIWTGAGTADYAVNAGELYVEGDLEADGTVYGYALMLSSGNTVNAIITDVTLAGNSNLALPTEHAVKTYVDVQIASSGGWSKTGNYVYLGSIGDNVGIGSNSPTAKLDVVGAAAISGDVTLGVPAITRSSALSDVLLSGNVEADGGIYGNVLSADAAIYGPGSFVVAADGNVGIGAIAPVARLDVRGDEARIWTGAGTNNFSTASGELYVEGDLESDGTLYGQSLMLSSGNTVSEIVTVLNGTASQAQLPTAKAVYDQVQALSISAGGWTEGANEVYLTAGTDNVGIGDSSPLARLVVGSDAGITYADAAGDDAYIRGHVEADGTLYGGALMLAGGNTVDTIVRTVSGSSSNLELPTARAVYNYVTSGASTIIQDSDSNVAVDDGSATPVLINVDGSPALAVTQVRNVGIGSIDPRGKLDVDGEIYASTAVFSGDVTVADQVYGAAWNGSLAVPTRNAVYDQMQAISVSAGGWTEGANEVYVTAGTDNVGIGDSTPAARLVVGSDAGITYADAAGDDAYIRGHVEADGTLYGGALMLTAGGNTVDTIITSVSGASSNLQLPTAKAVYDYVTSGSSTIIQESDSNVAVDDGTATPVLVNVDGSTALAVTTARNVGIGSIAPRGRLDVDGMIYGDTLFVDQNIYAFNGSIGVGTTTLNSALQVGAGTPDTLVAAGGNDAYVADDLEVDGTLYVGSGAAGTVNNAVTAGSLYVQNVLEVDGQVYSGSAILSGAVTVADEVYGSAWNGALSVPTKNAVYDQMQSLSTSAGGWTEGANEVYVTAGTDNVGIGDSTPAARLVVGSDAGITYADAAGDDAYIRGHVEADGTLYGGALMLTAGGNTVDAIVTSVSGTSSHLQLPTAQAVYNYVTSGASTIIQESDSNVAVDDGTATPVLVNVDGSTALAVTTARNVGIGSIAPRGRLDVDGMIYGDYLFVDQNIYAYNGSIGVGTTTLNSALQVGAGTPDTLVAAGGNDAYVADDLEVDGTLYVGSGAAGTVNNAVTAGSLYVQNVLEVDGQVYSGAAIFSGAVTVADEAYGAGWNGSISVPTKNAVYDQMQAISVSAGGWTEGANEVYLAAGTDNVGIGDSTPLAKLVVGSDAGISYADATGDDAYIRGHVEADGTLYGGALMLTAGGNTVDTIITSVSGASSNLQLPTAKAVYDYVTSGSSTIIQESDSNVAVDDGTVTPVLINVDGSTALAVTTARNVGIGSIAPRGRLDVDGMIYGDTLFVDQNIYAYNGSIGVGTTTLNSALQVGAGTPDTLVASAGNDAYVADDLEVDGTLYVGSGAAGTVNNAVTAGSLYVQNVLEVDGQVYSGSAIFTGAVTVADEAYGAGWNGALSVPTKNAVYDQMQSLSGSAGGWTEGANEVYLTTGTDNIGLGDSTPLARLVVGSDAGITYADATGDDAYIRGHVEADGTLYGGALMLTAGGNTVDTIVTSVSGSSSNLQLPTAQAVYNYVTSGASTIIQESDSNVAVDDGTATPISFTINGSQSVVIDNLGNVGIGDTSPSAALVVGSDATRTIADGSGDVYVQNDLEVDNGIYGPGSFTLTSAGSLGIGTSSPVSALTVSGDVTVINNLAVGDAVRPGKMVVNNGTATVYPTLGVGISVGDDNNRDIYGVRGNVSVNNTASNSKARFAGYFQTETLSSNSQDTTTYLYGVGGSVKHYGTGSINAIASVSQLSNLAAGTMATGIGSYVIVNNSSSGTMTDALGSWFLVRNTSNGTMTKAIGADYNIINSNSGTITTASVVGVDLINSGTGTITTAYGVNIGGFNETWANSGGGTVGTSYGLYLDPSIDIGNIRYSIYSASLSDSYMAGNFGIGSISPRAKLDVDGLIYGRDGLVADGIIYSSATGITATIARLDRTGGDLFAADDLEVDGTVYVGSGGAVDRAATNGSLYVQNVLEVDGEVYSGSAIFSGAVTVADEAYGAGWNGALSVPTKNAVYDQMQSLSNSAGGWTEGANEVYLTTGTDNIGLGDSTPLARLVVGSDAGISYADATGDDAYIRGHVEADGTLYGGALLLTAGGNTVDTIVTSVSGTSSNLQLPTARAVYNYVTSGASTIIQESDSNVAVDDGTATPVLVNVDGSTALAVTTARNVGIGSIAPRGRLDVDGMIYGDNLFVDQNIYAYNGSIGVGTTTLISALQVGAGTPDTLVASAGNDAYVADDLEVDGTLYVGSGAAGTVNNAVTAGSLYVQNVLEVDGQVYSGSAIFTGAVTVADEAYGAGWNGALSVPTKNAVYDQMQSLSGSAGGWTEGANEVYLTTGTDNIGLGDSTPLARLVVGSDAGISYADATGDDAYIRGHVEADGTLYGGALMLTAGGNTVDTIVTSVSGTSSNLQLPTARAVYNYVTSGASTIIQESDSNVAVDDGTATPVLINVDGSTALAVTTARNVGIGSIAPRGRLDVDGMIYGDYLFVDQNIYAYNGSIGVGTTTLNSALQVGAGTPDTLVAAGANDAYVADDLEVDGTLYVGSGAAGTVNNAVTAGSLYVQNVLEVDGQVYSGSAIFTGAVTVADEAYGAGWNGALSVPTKNAVYDQMQSLSGSAGGWTEGANEVYLTTGTDNIGLGDSTPLARLVVGSDAGITYADAAGDDAYIRGHVEADGTLYGGALMLTAGGNTVDTIVTSVSGTSSNLQIPTARAVYNYVTSGSSTIIQESDSNVAVDDGTATPISFTINGSQSVVIDNLGNMGIGDTTPSAALVVGSDATRTIVDGPGDVYVQNDLEVDNGIYGPGSFTLTSAGSLGIGTSAPLHALTVSGNSNVTGSLAVGANAISGVAWGYNNTMTVYPDLSVVKSVGDFAGRASAVFGWVFLDNTAATSQRRSGGKFGVEVPLSNNQNSTGVLSALEADAIIYGSGNHTTLDGVRMNISHIGAGTLTNARGEVNFVWNYKSGTMSTAKSVWTQVANASDGIITDARGADFNIGNFGSGTITTASVVGVDIVNSGSGTITTAYGVNIGGPGETWANSGGGTVGTTYGLYLDPSIDIGNTRYSIYSSSLSNSYMAGNLGIGSFSPRAKLDVDGLIYGRDGLVADGIIYSSATGMTATIARLDRTGGDLFAADDLEVDGTVYVGSGGAVDRAATNGSLYVQNVLEVDGEVYSGSAIFSGAVTVADEAYGAGWNGSISVPTKNAVYDQMQSLSGSAGGWTEGANEVYLTTGTDNIGLGDSTPLARLVVGSDAGITYADATGDDAYIRGHLEADGTLYGGALMLAAGGNTVDTIVTSVSGTSSNLQIPTARAVYNYVTSGASTIIQESDSNVAVDDGTATPVLINVDGSTALAVTTARNVGIGSLAPRGRLDVDGMIYGDTLFVDQNIYAYNGSIGVGTTTLNSALQIGAGSPDTLVAGGSNDAYVADDLEVDGTVYVGSGAAGTVNNAVTAGSLYVQNVLEVDGQVYSGSAIFSGAVTVADEAYGAGWNGSISVPTKNAVYDQMQSLSGSAGGWTEGANEVYLTTGTDNIGLGDSTPLARLVVGSDAGITYADATGDDAYIRGHVEADGTLYGGALMLTAGGNTVDTIVTSVSGTSSNLQIPTAKAVYDYITSGASTIIQESDSNVAVDDGTATPISFTINGSQSVVFDNLGNVGIGDTTPSAALVVGSDATRTISNGSGDVYVQNDLEVDNGIYGPGSFTLTSAGSLGIGTSVPLHALSVSGNSNVTGSLGIGDTAMPGMIVTSDGTVNVYPRLGVDITVTDDNSRQIEAHTAILRLANTASNSKQRYAGDFILETSASNNQNSTGSLRAAGHKLYHYGTGTITSAMAAYANLENNSSGTITTARANHGQIGNYGSGTITNARATDFNVVNHGSGTITTASVVGVDIVNSGSGTITTAYGVNIGGPGENWANSGGGTVGTTYGLYLDPTIDIGNTRYSIYSASLSNSYMAGNLGIGSFSPRTKLDVDGLIYGRDGLAADGIIYSSATGMTATIARLDRSGGDLFAADDLEVDGTVYVGSGGAVDRASTSGSLYVQNVLEVDGEVYSGSAILSGAVTVADEAYGAGWNGALSVPTKNAVYDQMQSLSGSAGGWTEGANEVYLTTGTDNIGLGDSTPLARLVVGSDAGITYADATGDDAYIRGHMEADGTLYGGALMLAAGGNTVDAIITSVSGTSSNLQIPTAKAVYDYITSGASTIIQESDSNVAVDDGTATPISFSINGSRSMVIDQNGNVGIGTLTPASLLTVSSAADAVLFIQGDNDNVGGDDGTQNSILRFAVDGEALGWDITYRNYTGRSNLEFSHSSLGTPLTITSLGNIGISSTTPYSKLDVDGLIYGHKGLVVDGIIYSIPSTMTATIARLDRSGGDLFAADDLEVDGTVYVGSGGAVDRASTSGSLYVQNVLEVDGEVYSGSAIFSGAVTVADEAYGAGWNGNLSVPTKNAVYDQVQSLSSSSTIIQESDTNIAIDDGTSTPISFTINGSKSIVADNLGYLGIGDTSPAAALVVGSDAGVTYARGVGNIYAQGNIESDGTIYATQLGVGGQPDANTGALVQAPIMTSTSGTGYGLLSAMYTSASASPSTAAVYGASFVAASLGTADYTNAVSGVSGNATHAGSGTVTVLSGVSGNAINSSAGTVAVMMGNVAAGNTNTGGGTVTQSYEMFVNNGSVPFTANNQYRIGIGLIPSPDPGAYTNIKSHAIWINSDTTTERGGIVWGANSDTNLYRGGVNILSTDDTLTVAQKVGIGTTAPFAKLDVDGLIYGQKGLVVDGIIYSLPSTMSATIARLDRTGGDLYAADDLEVDGTVYVGSGGAVDRAATNGSLYVQNVLEVDGEVYAGSAIFSGSVTVADDAYAAGWNGNLSVPTKNAVYDQIQSIGGSSTIIQDSDTKISIKDGSASPVSFVINGSQSLVIDGNGYMGMGTTAPVYPLSIKNQYYGLGVYNSANALKFAVHSDPNAGPYVWINSSAVNVPDGTASGASAGGALYIVTPNVVSQENGIFFSNSTGSGVPTAAVTSYITSTATWGIGGLHFKTDPDGSALLTRMTVDQVGNVGINTLRPGAKLQVDGLIYASQGMVVDGIIYSIPSTAVATIARLDRTGGDLFAADDLEVDGTVYVGSGGAADFVSTNGSLFVESNIEIDDSLYIGTGEVTDMVLINNTALFASEVSQTCADGGSVTIDWRSGNKQRLILTDNTCTVSFTAPQGVGNLLLKVVQSAGGSDLITWPASSLVKWPAATAPTLTTTGSAIDIVTFYYDGSVYYGVGSLDFQ